MTDIDIDAIRPATDLLLAQMRETVGEIQAHVHPKGTEDFFCLNLTSWLGERMGPVLRRLADEQAEARSWKDRNTALADEFTAEAERLNAKVDELTAELAEARQQRDTHADIARTRAEVITDLTRAVEGSEAKVTELTAQLERNGREHGDTIDDRDRYHQMADDLAEAIAKLTGVEIGEHSNMNDPWQNALQAGTEAAEAVAR